MSRNSNKIRILLVGDLENLQVGLEGASYDGKQLQVIGCCTTAEELLSCVTSLYPDVLVVDGDAETFDALECIQDMFVRDYPVCSIILWAEQDTAKIRHAMRCGAEDFLLKPVDIDKLVESINTVFGIVCERFPNGWDQQASTAATTPLHLCQVIGLTSGKPGVGKTTLAANLAVTLAREFDKRVALVDLQFGDAAVALSLRPKRALAELVSLGEELDRQILNDYVVHHDSGVDLFSGFVQPDFREAQTIDAGSLRTILQVMAQEYEFIFVVFPFLVGEDALLALSVMDQVLVITAPTDLLTIRDTKLFLDAIDGDFVEPKKIAVVLNRVDKKGAISPEDVKKTLKRPLLAEIPSDRNLATASINLGVPLVISKPKAEVSAEIRKLAAHIAGTHIDEKPEGKRGFSLFGGR